MSNISHETIMRASEEISNALLEIARALNNLAEIEKQRDWENLTINQRRLKQGYLVDRKDEL
jgi:hypothetical protein